MAHTFEKEASEALLKYGLQNDSPPSDFYIRLTMDDFSEIPAANGYTAGGNTVSFSAPTTGSDYAQIKTARTVFASDGGNLPSYGAIQFAELTDDAGTLLCRFDFGTGIIIPILKQLAITSVTIKLQQVSVAGATFTINGLKGLLQWTFIQTGAPSTFYAALLTADSPVGETLGACEEIPAGNGYASGGIAVARSTSGFIELVNNWQPVRYASIKLSQQSYETAGGTLPKYGSAKKIAITTDGTPISSRQVLVVLDFPEPAIAPNGKLIYVKNGTLWINET